MQRFCVDFVQKVIEEKPLGRSGRRPPPPPPLVKEGLKQDPLSSIYSPGQSIYTEYSKSPFHRVWQGFITIEVSIDRIPAITPSCKKQLTRFFVHSLFS